MDNTTNKNNLNTNNFIFNDVRHENSYILDEKERMKFCNKH